MALLSVTLGHYGGPEVAVLRIAPGMLLRDTQKGWDAPLKPVLAEANLSILRDYLSPGPLVWVSATPELWSMGLRSCTMSSRRMEFGAQGHACHAVGVQGLMLERWVHSPGHSFLGLAS